jgi:hypothetical protein
MDYSHKVIFKTVKDGFGGNSRYVFYKVDPSELSFFGKLFNPWRILRRAYFSLPGLTTLFDTKDYENFVLPLKTLGDVKLFEQYSKDKSRRNELSTEKQWENVINNKED